MKPTSGLFFLFLFLAACTSPRTVKDSLNFVRSSGEFVEIQPSSLVVIDLKYATPDNFVGKNMYGEFNRAFLHREAAKSMSQAATSLQKIHPQWKLIIYDALRPRSVQYLLWEKVEGTPNEQYVADPKIGSIHNYGLALDLSIVNERGIPIDMGTPYDTFDPLAQPKLEEEFLKSGKLTRKQVQNRKLLRKVMTEAGFIQLPHEWWHYDRFERSEIKSRFIIVE